MLKTTKALKIAKTATRAISKHSNVIFSTLAMLGLAGTAYEMVNATIKAVKICEEKQVKGGKEVIRTVWKLYIRGVGFMLLTTLSIAGQARKVHVLGKQLVTATGLYTASQADLKSFKDKATEILGAKKTEKVEHDIEQEKILRCVPPKESDVAVTGHGNQLFQLSLNGGYFRANPDWVKLKVQELDAELHGDPWNRIMASRILEEFNQPYCDIGEMEYDLAQMLEEGYSNLSVDISECHWDPKFGNQEIVSVVKITPGPSRH